MPLLMVDYQMLFRGMSFCERLFKAFAVRSCDMGRLVSNHPTCIACYDPKFMLVVNSRC